jgi:hypothetical protein
MDFLDPEKHRRHMVTIAIGYCFIALAVGMATLVLLYYAYGFSFGKNGQVIQNGLMFVSSTPNPANVYLNGKLNKVQTNSRITLEEGEYFMQLKRDGYRTWQRSVTIDGGKVVHYDYPFLIPTTLTSTALKTYDEPPQITMQSPDKRWLIVNRASSVDQFEVFDLKNPKTAVTSENITVPADLLSKATASQSWQLVEWSNDNRHVLLRHMFDGGSEYILLDRASPDKSLNLTQTLGQNPTELRLVDKKYDRYYLLDATKQTLSSASLSAPQPELRLDHVLAFKSYGSDTILYAAAAGADTDGSVRLKLVEGTHSYTLRELPPGTTYLVDIAKYDGSIYLAATASSENKVYVYENPVAQINDATIGQAIPVQVLRVTAPTYMSFSANTRFVMAEGGQSFGVYDAEDEKGFTYTVSDTLDAPQEHATWMDGHRLMYVSGGTVTIFDYDNINRQKLVADKPGYLPSFDASFKYLFTFAPNEQDAAKTSLSSTPLRTLADR